MFSGGFLPEVFQNSKEIWQNTHEESEKLEKQWRLYHRWSYELPKKVPFILGDLKSFTSFGTQKSNDLSD